MRSFCYGLLFILTLQFSDCYSQGKDASLVATPYPGSVMETYVEKSSSSEPKVPIESRLQVFYSKDPIDKVKAHYTKSIGAFQPLPGDETSYSHPVIPYKELSDFLSEHGILTGEAQGDFVRGEFAGVTLSGPLINQNPIVAEVLDKLQSAYLVGFSNEEDPTQLAKHIEDPEWKKTLTKYEHIALEHFPLSKEKRMDEVLFDKYYTLPEEATAKEQKEMTDKISSLSKQGKYEEAGKLGDQMMALFNRGTDAKLNWQTAIKCLDEMEKHAYATKIVIDKHPSKWDLSSYNKK